MRYFLLLLLCSLCAPAAVPAQEAQTPKPADAQTVESEPPDHDPLTGRPRRIDPDRPHVSEAPVVVGEGTFQIESGVLYANSRTVGEAAGVSTPTLLRIGTSHDTELRIESDFLNYQSRQLGLGDVSLGLKHVFWDEDVELAMLYTYSFVTGSSAFRGVAEPEIKMLIGFELSEKTEVEVNLGARSTVDPDSSVRFAQGTFAVAVTHSLVPHQLAVFGELYGDGPIQPGRGAALVGQAGFLYRLDDDTQLDMEFLRGLSSSGLDWGLGIGVSARY